MLPTHTISGKMISIRHWVIRVLSASILKYEFICFVGLIQRPLKKKKTICKKLRKSTTLFHLFNWNKLLVPHNSWPVLMSCFLISSTFYRWNFILIYEPYTLVGHIDLDSFLTFFSKGLLRSNSRSKKKVVAELILIGENGTGRL